MEKKTATQVRLEQLDEEVRRAIIAERGRVVTAQEQLEHRAKVHSDFPGAPVILRQSAPRRLRTSKPVIYSHPFFDLLDC